MEGSRSPPSLQPEQAHCHLLILFMKEFCFQFKIHQSGLTSFTKQIGSLRPERHQG